MRNCVESILKYRVKRLNSFTIKDIEKGHNYGIIRP